MVTYSLKIITDLQLQKLQIWQPLQQRVLLLNASSCKCCRFKMLKFAIQFDWLNMKSVASLWSAYPENTVLTTINACYPTRLPLCPLQFLTLFHPSLKLQFIASSSRFTPLKFQTLFCTLGSRLNGGLFPKSYSTRSSKIGNTCHL